MSKSNKLHKLNTFFTNCGEFVDEALEFVEQNFWYIIMVIALIVAVSGFKCSISINSSGGQITNSISYGTNK